MLDYKQIKKRLKDVYQMENFNRKGFEKSTFFSEKLDEKAYTKAYVRFDMSTEGTTPLNEDGVACATAGNTSGMGAVVSAQPSSVPGQTTGADFTANGGTTGSGDIGVNRNVRSRDTVPGRKRRKGKLQTVAKAMAKGAKSASTPSKFDPAVPMKPSGKIQSFSDFAKK